MLPRFEALTSVYQYAFFIKIELVHNERSKAMINVFIVGAGSVFDEKWSAPLQMGVKEGRLKVVGILEPALERLHRAHQMFRGSIIWACRDVEELSPVATDSVILVLAPNHFPVIKEFSDWGCKQFIVEKPLVSCDHEVTNIAKLIETRALKIYAVDHYLPKLLALQLMTKGSDLRQAYIEWPGRTIYPHVILDALGDLEGVAVTILEGGDFCLPDLDKRPWLEHDPDIGGMLRDLGTHALAPLAACGWLDEDAEVVIAQLAKISDDRRRLHVLAHSKSVEMYVSALIVSKGVPIHVTLGKIPTAGGQWSLAVRGTKGMLFAGIRSGQSLVAVPASGEAVTFSLKCSVYQFILQEACWFFEGRLPNFDGNVSSMFTALQLIQKIRNHYFGQ